MPDKKDEAEVRVGDAVVAEEEGAPLSAKEVDLESQRKDETSSLAHDQYDQDGNRLDPKTGKPIK